MALWLRDGRNAMPGAAGGAILFLYGVVPTFQPAYFGRLYPACGGIFVVLSLLWVWRFDGNRPDRFDWLGADLCFVGVPTIMYAPRS